MVDVIDGIECTEHDGEEHHHVSETEVESMPHSFESAPLAYPTADDRCSEVGHGILVDHERRPREKCTHCCTDE